jgi:hypothetical protein
MSVVNGAATMISSPPSSAPSPVLPMRPASVPRLGARYWTAISLASVAGCDLGDVVSLSRPDCRQR